MDEIKEFQKRRQEALQRKRAAEEELRKRQESKARLSEGLKLAQQFAPKAGDILRSFLMSR